MFKATEMYMMLGGAASAVDEVETLFKFSLTPQVEALFKSFADTYEALFFSSKVFDHCD
jgi:hypothetical protein